MAKQFGIQARLKIGGVATDITGFTLDVPTGALGARLSCPLADFEANPDTSQPTKFEIAITKNGVTDWATLLDNARILDSSFTTQLAGDQTTLNAVSKLAELWRYTPRQPVTLYDPAQVDIITETQQARRDVVDSDGNAIESIYTPVDDFDLNQLLSFVYTEKLGFGQVVTNIPNYPLPRADFNLRSPWHAVAAGQVALFEPQYASDDLSRLFIIDPQGALPDGFPDTVRSVPAHSYIVFTRSKQTAPQTNAVLLTYKDNFNAATGNITDRTDQEIQEIGTFGEADWHRTVINRFVKEFHSDTSHPARITREIVWKVETRTSAKAGGVVREIAIETQTDTYEYDYQLKTGYVKTVQLYTKLPGTGALMRQVQIETNQILWTASMSNPSELQKTWETTQITGTILVEGDEDDEENPAVKTSLYDANRTNNIPDDAAVQLGKPIKTIIERWREIGPDQIEVAYQIVDHLTGKPEQNRTVQHTGTNIARLDRNAQSAVTMLLRDEASELDNGPLPPAALDAGDVPFESALPLAQRILDRHGNQQQQVTISFAGIDVALRRGSLRRVSDRNNEYLVFITGYQITGSNLGSFESAEIRQTAQGIVLQEL